MIILLAFSYRNETKICRDWVTPMLSGNADECMAVCGSKCIANTNTGANESVIKGKWGLPDLIIPNENETNDINETIK